MIPLILKLKGIYSYQEEQTIEFQNLLAGQLFGIFGAVGSGKSTILEAITFALYGDTERLNQRDNRNYNMMNLKSNELLIDFTFHTGLDEQRYRFTVSGKRSGKRFDDVRTFERRAYKKENGEWTPIEVSDAKEITGLSYKNFRRTIIIPQGKFQEFLQLGDKDRTQMMKEIFQLEKFDLFYKVASLESKNNQKKENLTGRLAQLGAVDTAEIETAEENHNVFKQALEKEKQLFSEKEKTEKEQDKLKEIFDKLKLQKQIFDKLKTQEPEFQALEQQIKSYRECSQQFKHLLDRKSELENDVQLSEKHIAEKTKEAEVISAQLEEKNKQFETVKTDYEQIPNWQKTADELQLLLKVKQTEQEIAELENRLKKGETYFTDAEKTLKEKKATLTGLEQTVKLKKQSLPDHQQLAEIREWFGQKKNIAENLTKAETEIQEIKIAQQEIDSKKNELLTIDIKDMIDAYDGEIDLKDLTETIQAEIEQWKKLHEQFVESEKDLIAKSKLEEVAANLQDGKPCLVCGSTHHPNVLKIEDVQAELTEVHKKAKQLGSQIDELQKTYQALNILFIKWQEKESALKNKETEVSGIKEKFTQHTAQFKWEKYSPEDEELIQKEAEKYKAVAVEIKHAEDKIEQLRNEFDQLATEKENAQKTFQEIKGKYQSKTAGQNTLIEQIKHLDIENYKTQIPKEIEKQISGLEQKIQQTKQLHEQLQEDINELNNKFSSLNGELNQAGTSLKKQKEQLQKMNDSISDALAKSKYSSLDEIRQILETKFDLENEEKKLSDYKQALHTAYEQYKVLQQETQNRTFNETAYQNLKTEIATLKSTLSEKEKEAVRLEESLKKMKADFKQQQELQKELDAINERGDNIKTLRQLFKGSGFVNYISSVYLENLCKAANDRFYKLTRQKLRLEMGENNNFVVRDFLNNGQVRSVKTLSGGQTFQASLSLALSLAESIHKQNQTRQNFFFLDEGFGSQDKESLQVVFETLKSLRKEDRIVGIISHVEELQQEIDVFLKIENDEEKGSKIEESWS